MVREVDASAGVQLGRRRRGGVPSGHSRRGDNQFYFPLLPSRWAPYMKGFDGILPSYVSGNPEAPISCQCLVLGQTIGNRRILWGPSELQIQALG